MLFINNPEALVAIETERRRELGLRSTVGPDHVLTNSDAGDGAPTRSTRHRIFGRMAPARYATS